MMQAFSLRRLSPLLLLAAALVALSVLFAPGAQPAQAQTTEKVAFGYDLSPDFPYNVSVDESVGTVRVPVTVSALPASSLAVSVSATNVTAEDGLDYTFGTAKTVTFSSTDDGRTQFVEFPVTDDTTFENEEFLKLNLALPGGVGTGYGTVTDGASGRAEAFVTIVDNDLSATPTGKQYAITPSVTVEEGATAELTVTLGENAPAGDLTFTVTAEYCRCDANDLNRFAVPADVGTVPATVTVAAGTQTATLSIPIPIDTEAEADEHFHVIIATTAMGWSAVTGGNEGAVIITNVTPTQSSVITHWSDTLTAKAVDYGFGCGYRSGQPQCDDALTDDDFTYDGVAYTVELVHVAYNGGTLQFILDKEAPVGI